MTLLAPLSRPASTSPGCTWPCARLHDHTRALEDTLPKDLAGVTQRQDQDHLFQGTEREAKSFTDNHDKVSYTKLHQVPPACLSPHYCVWSAFSTLQVWVRALQTQMSTGASEINVVRKAKETVTWVRGLALPKVSNSWYFLHKLSLKWEYVYHVIWNLCTALQTTPRAAFQTKSYKACNCSDSQDTDVVFYFCILQINFKRKAKHTKHCITLLHNLSFSV